MTPCPVCGGTDAVDTVVRPRLPAMQNYVHRTRESALSALRGRLTLAVCRSCGFGWNRTFDSSLLVYDEGYDNTVPSEFMRAYYAELVDSLRGRYPLEDGLVVDVGCGDGAFLRQICAAVPTSRGLGIDPALERDAVEEGGRIKLVKAPFTPDAVDEAPALVVSRHVLEHMPDPVAFLDVIAQALGRFGPCPAYFEVPDLRWIVEHNAFWDFCYEHCNYFTAESLGEALCRAGFGVTAARVGFGSQYLQLDALSDAAKPAATRGAGRELAARLLAYAEAESDRIASFRTRLSQLKREGAVVAVWGMATKGVLFSVLVDPDAALIDMCVDVNENKQGCFVPVTGHRISPPADLPVKAEDGPLAVVVMNENYRREIEESCRALGVDFAFVDLDDAAVAQ